MKSRTRKRQTRDEKEKENDGVAYFWTFAPTISESLTTGKEFLPNKDEQKALRHVYNRLRREMVRRTESGRPRKPTDKVIQAIADQIIWEGKKASVKYGRTLEELCQSKGTTYKTFWRRWNNKDSAKRKSLAEELMQIEIISRLAKGFAIQGTEDETNFRRIKVLLRKLEEKAKNQVTLKKEKLKLNN